MEPTFWPSGPFMQIAMAFLAWSVFWAFLSKNWPALWKICAALVAVWIAARYSTLVADLRYSLVAMALAGVFLILYVRTNLAILIGLLYAPRLLVMSLHLFDISSQQMAWDMAEAALWMQYILLYIGTRSGGFRRLSAWRVRDWNRAGDFGNLPAKAWLQRRAF